MATRTVVRSHVQAERAHDHVYDPVYTVSKASEHVRMHQQAAVAGVTRLSNWNNFFGATATAPSYSYQLRLNHAHLPASPFPPRQHGGPSKAQRHAAAESAVHGADRHKYFKRPIAPFLHGLPAEVVLAPEEGAAGGAEGAAAAAAAAAEAEAEAPRSRTVATQTLYRESEAQTDPYTPEYRVAEGAPAPEVLEIAHLKHGVGLPAGLDEVNLIHRIREKRELEASLPPPTDERSIEQRRKMLEEQELREWALREEEMKKEQEQRLQVLVDRLRERDQKQQEMLDRRLEAVRAKHAKDTARARGAADRQRVKIARSLNKLRDRRAAGTTGLAGTARATSGGAASGPGSPRSPGGRRDIIGEYASRSSKVYAPATRDGAVPAANPVVDYGIPLLDDYRGLEELEQTRLRGQTEVRAAAPAQVTAKAMATREGQHIANQLDLVDRLLHATSGDAAGSARGSAPPTENVYRRFEPLVRPPTPTVAPEDDGTERAAVLVQRLVRGRTVQNVMHEGKESCLDLIRELQLAEVRPATAECGTGTDAGLLERMALEAFGGGVVASTLDFVAREAVQAGALEGAAAVVAEAEQTRRTREAEEAGSRQARRQEAAAKDAEVDAILQQRQDGGSADEEEQEEAAAAAAAAEEEKEKEEGNSADARVAGGEAAEAAPSAE